MIWTLSPQQEQRIRELIPACCNWEQGHCLPLDIPCLQQLSPSRVSCKYFRTAVLPAEKELYAEIIRQNRKDGDDNGLPRMV